MAATKTPGNQKVLEILYYTSILKVTTCHPPTSSLYLAVTKKTQLAIYTLIMKFSRIFISFKEQDETAGIFDVWLK